MLLFKKKYEKMADTFLGHFATRRDALNARVRTDGDIRIMIMTEARQNTHTDLPRDMAQFLALAIFTFQTRAARYFFGSRDSSVPIMFTGFTTNDTIARVSFRASNLVMSQWVHDALQDPLAVALSHMLSSFVEERVFAGEPVADTNTNRMILPKISQAISMAMRVYRGDYIVFTDRIPDDIVNFLGLFQNGFTKYTNNLVRLVGEVYNPHPNVRLLATIHDTETVAAFVLNWIDPTIDVEEIRTSVDDLRAVLNSDEASDESITRAYRDLNPRLRRWGQAVFWPENLARVRPGVLQLMRIDPGAVPPQQVQEVPPPQQVPPIARRFVPLTGTSIGPRSQAPASGFAVPMEQVVLDGGAIIPPFAFTRPSNTVLLIPDLIPSFRQQTEFMSNLRRGGLPYLAQVHELYRRKVSIDRVDLRGVGRLVKNSSRVDIDELVNLLDSTPAIVDQTAGQHRDRMLRLAQWFFGFVDTTTEAIVEFIPIENVRGLETEIKEAMVRMRERMRDMIIAGNQSLSLIEKLMAELIIYIHDLLDLVGTIDIIEAVRGFTKEFNRELALIQGRDPTDPITAPTRPLPKPMYKNPTQDKQPRSNTSVDLTEAVRSVFLPRTSPPTPAPPPLTTTSPPAPRPPTTANNKRKKRNVSNTDRLGRFDEEEDDEEGGAPSPKIPRLEPVATAETAAIANTIPNPTHSSAQIPPITTPTPRRITPTLVTTPGSPAPANSLPTPQSSSAPPSLDVAPPRSTGEEASLPVLQGARGLATYVSNLSTSLGRYTKNQPKFYDNPGKNLSKKLEKNDRERRLAMRAADLISNLKNNARNARNAREDGSEDGSEELNDEGRSVDGGASLRSFIVDDTGSVHTDDPDYEDAVLERDDVLPAADVSMSGTIGQRQYDKVVGDIENRVAGRPAAAVVPLTDEQERDLYERLHELTREYILARTAAQRQDIMTEMRRIYNDFPPDNLTEQTEQTEQAYAERERMDRLRVIRIQRTSQYMFGIIDTFGNVYQIPQSVLDNPYWRRLANIFFSLNAFWYLNENPSFQKYVELCNTLMTFAIRAYAKAAKLAEDHPDVVANARYTIGNVIQLFVSEGHPRGVRWLSTKSHFTKMLERHTAKLRAENIVNNNDLTADPRDAARYISHLGIISGHYTRELASIDVPNPLTDPRSPTNPSPEPIENPDDSTLPGPVEVAPGTSPPGPVTPPIPAPQSVGVGSDPPPAPPGPKDFFRQVHTAYQQVMLTPPDFKNPLNMNADEFTDRLNYLKALFGRAQSPANRERISNFIRNNIPYTDDPDILTLKNLLSAATRKYGLIDLHGNIYPPPRDSRYQRELMHRYNHFMFSFIHFWVRVAEDMRNMLANFNEYAEDTVNQLIRLYRYATGASFNSARRNSPGMLYDLVSYFRRNIAGRGALTFVSDFSETILSRKGYRGPDRDRVLGRYVEDLGNGEEGVASRWIATLRPFGPQFVFDPERPPQPLPGMGPPPLMQGGVDVRPDPAGPAPPLAAVAGDNTAPPANALIAELPDPRPIDMGGVGGDDDDDGGASDGGGAGDLRLIQKAHRFLVRTMLSQDEDEFNVNLRALHMVIAALGPPPAPNMTQLARIEFTRGVVDVYGNVHGVPERHPGLRLSRYPYRTSFDIFRAYNDIFRAPITPEEFAQDARGFMQQIIALFNNYDALGDRKLRKTVAAIRNVIRFFTTGRLSPADPNNPTIRFQNATHVMNYFRNMDIVGRELDFTAGDDAAAFLAHYIGLIGTSTNWINDSDDESDDDPDDANDDDQGGGSDSDSVPSPPPDNAGSPPPDNTDATGAPLKPAPANTPARPGIPISTLLNPAPTNTPARPGIPISTLLNPAPTNTPARPGVPISTLLNPAPTNTNARIPTRTPTPIATNAAAPARNPPLVVVAPVRNPPGAAVGIPGPVAGAPRPIGTKVEVWRGFAERTRGGLTRDQLRLNAKCKVVSIRASNAAMARRATEVAAGGVGATRKFGRWNELVAANNNHMPMLAVQARRNALLAAIPPLAVPGVPGAPPVVP